MNEFIDIKFMLEFGELNGRSMFVEADTDYIKAFANINSPNLNIFKVQLPTKLKIKFSGKRLGKDTQIDDNGNIIKDMYVKITGIQLDNLVIPDWIIQKKLSYITEAGELIRTSYIGFNGVMDFSIPENNIFSFYRRLNKND
jgi:hypothetical protein